jgi:hypothetical protein
MPTTESKRRSSFGINCVQCGNELVAPERSEYRDERHVLHLWRRSRCDRSFEVIWSAVGTMPRRLPTAVIVASAGRFDAGAKPVDQKY